MSSTGSSPPPGTTSAEIKLDRIAVGVDGWPEGLDAVVLGAALARAVGAELVLIAIVPGRGSGATPAWVGWQGMREEAEAVLAHTRDSLAPEARTEVRSNASAARGLERFVAEEGCDVLVVGPSRFAAEGHVRLAKRTRTLIGHGRWPLAIAPHALHHKPDPALTRIGVGYDGSREAEAAVALAGSIAARCASALRILGVVDDLTPAFGAPGAIARAIVPEWEDVMQAEVGALTSKIAVAARALALPGVTTEVRRGRPAQALLELAGDLDLLVLGSSGWGAPMSVGLGSTSEAVLHGASCPILITPRPGETVSDRPPDAGARRILVVAHRTAPTPTLLEQVHARSQRASCSFTLLVPCPYWDPETEEAEKVIELAVPLLEQAAGAHVEAMVGDSDPFAAVRDALASSHFDEVIVSTLPRRVSHWLRLDLPARLERLGVPVSVVTARESLHAWRP